MALSGTITQGFCSRNGANRFYLQIQWSATQNVANNNSTVTAKVYLGSYGNGYNINASATKSGSLTINGTTYSFTTAGCTIASGGTKLLYTKSVTIGHNADGTKTFNLGAYFNPAVTISGSSSGSVTISTRNVTLNTIPRKSTISSGTSWTAPWGNTINISRASSSFTHTVKIYVNNVFIKQYTGVGTSCAFSFTMAENTTIFQQLAGANKTSKIELLTYSGGTHIGTNTYTGTCTISAPSTITSSTSYTTGNPNIINISKPHGDFRHLVQWYTNGQLIHEAGNVDASVTWTPSAGHVQTAENIMWNCNSIGCSCKVTTYYNGVYVGVHTKNGTAYVNSNGRAPTILSGAYLYEGATLPFTKSSDLFIQGLSTIKCYVPNPCARANRGASLVRYDVIVDGYTYSVNDFSKAHNLTIGTMRGSSATVTFKATDSRGNTASWSGGLNVQAFAPTTIYASTKRKNNFEREVTLSVWGTFDPLIVEGVQRNSISNATTLQVRYTKINGATHNGSWTKLTNITSDPSARTWQASATLDIDTVNSVDMELIIYTELTSALCTTNCPKGQPIFSIDTNKNSIGINMLPNSNNELQINGGVYTNGYIITGNDKFWCGNGTYGLHMANSDIIAANAIYFQDNSDASTEGLMWLNSGCPYNSTNENDYTRFKIIDGRVLVQNGSKGQVMIGNANVHDALWSGCLYMSEGQNVYLNTVTEYQIGWLLIWSDYDESSGVANNYNFVSSIIPKQLINIGGGHTWYFSMPCGFSSTGVTYTMKELRVYSDRLEGQPYNDDSTNTKDVVLRYVFGL